MRMSVLYKRGEFSILNIVWMWFPNPYFKPRLAAIIKRYLKTQREEDKKKIFYNTDLYHWEFKYKCSTTSTSIHLRQADIHSLNKHLLSVYVSGFPGLF